LTHRRQAQLPELGLQQVDRDIDHGHGPPKELQGQTGLTG
jgi:hypothetical protein